MATILKWFKQFGPLTNFTEIKAFGRYRGTTRTQTKTVVVIIKYMMSILLRSLDT